MWDEQRSTLRHHSLSLFVYLTTKLHQTDISGSLLQCSANAEQKRRARRRVVTKGVKRNWQRDTVYNEEKIEAGEEQEGSRSARDME